MLELSMVWKDNFWRLTGLLGFSLLGAKQAEAALCVSAMFQFAGTLVAVSLSDITLTGLQGLQEENLFLGHSPLLLTCQIVRMLLEIINRFTTKKMI